LHQIELSEIIASNWGQLNRFVRKSRLSASVPIKDRYLQRALIPRKTFTEYKREYVLSSHDRLFEVRTDIARFYPSVYTHSISWALHKKLVAKRKRHDLSLLGNKLDKACSACQSGQTIGLPIGPDTSFLISEVIATAIDVRLCAEFPNIRGYRYIDDYHLFLKSQEEAERVLKYLQSLFADYELDLNDAKTDVVRFPQSFESSWTINLSSFKLHDTGSRQRRDISNYFSLAFEYHNKYPEQSVIRYAVKKLFNLKVDPLNWRFFQSLLLKTTLSNPLIIPDTLRILLVYKSQCDKRMVRDVVEQLLFTHVGKWHSYEVAWTLWLAKSFRIRIHKKLAEQIFQSGDQFPILICFDMMDHGLVSERIDTSFLGGDFTAGSLFDENWLFTYEMISKKWLKPNKPRIIKKNPFFRILHENEVTFYEQGKQLEDAQTFLKVVPKTGVKPRIEHFVEEY
jgi:hypothetical protein